MGQPIAKIGNTATGICSLHAPARVWVGAINRGSSTCTCEGVPIARVGDGGTTDCGHTFTITTGSAIFKDDGKAVARVGDSVVIDQGNINGIGGTGIITNGSAIAVSD